MTKQEKFKQLLKTIFQYSKDKIDLDFGVYKVFKNNEKEIYEFVENKLPIFLEEQFNKINIEKNITIEDCYNDILNFFMKYYEGGDFYPAQYFSPNSKKHMLRHNGEEVIFSWANKDQYYIKNLSNFNDYTFEAPKEWFDDGLIAQSNKIVHFKMDTENIDELTGNKKDTRNYVLIEDKTELRDDGLFIYFGFKNGTSVTSEILLDHLKEKHININSIDEIEQHLKKFINVRKSDFFIHKNLYKFLTEELDYYIKSEIVDIDKPSTLTRAKVIRTVAEYIIQFLSRLEELQRVLWEKKKFAYDVNYIITLDKINKELLEKIIYHSNFQNQKDEWINDLNFIDKFDESIVYTDDLHQELNPEYKYLPLDTKHFDDDILKYEILEQFENLDDEIDGILINSDNFHGLNYLQKRFKEKVKCVYIDPPYNTGDDGFVYKDNYKHSSWLSMIKDRLLLTSKLMNEFSLLYIQVDDNENHNLDMLLNNETTYEQLIELYIQTRYAQKTLVEDMDFQKLIETIKVCRQSHQAKLIKETEEYTYNKFEWEIKTIKEPDKVLELGGKKVEVYQKGSYEIIKKKPSKFRLKEIWASGKILSGNSSGRFFRDFLQGREHEDNLETLYKVYDIGDDIYDFRYFTGPKQAGRTKGKYYQGVPVSKMEASIKELMINNYFNYSDAFGNCRQEGGVELRNGKKPEILLRKILNFSIDDNDNHSYILDYFAGSGTTAAVAHKMNKKYLAMEMDDYFDELTLRRIKNVLFGDQTGISKELNFKGGGIVKYLRLEQYEDTLHNTSFSNNTLNSKLTILDKYKETLPYLYENKFISLAKDVSLQNSPSLLLQVKNEFLCDPFNYTFEIYKDNKYTTTKIDLVETFNTLMGFEINSIKQKFFLLNNKRYLFIDAKKEVVVWREVSSDEISKEFIKQEEEFIKEHIDTTKKIYMNGINSYYTKAFLDGQATETLYAFRKILMDGVKGGN